MRNPFGPLAWWEIRRLGRSRRLWQLRVWYVLTLLVVQFLFFLNYFAPNSWAAMLGLLPLTLDELAQFGSAYHTTFVVAEGVLLFLIVPILFIELVSSASDRQMLDLLRCSPLSNFELIFGLMLPRVVIVAGLLLHCAPILAISTLYGGVGGSEVLSWQLTLFGAMLLWGTIGTHAGLVSQGRLSSYGGAYLTGAIVAMFSFCIGACAGSFVAVILMSTGLTFAILAQITRELRPQATPPKQVNPPAAPSQKMTVTAQPDPMLAPPLEGRDPWMWKEQYFPRRNNHLFFFDLMVQILLWSSAVFEAMAIVTMSTWCTSDRPTYFVQGAFLVFGLYFVSVASIRTSLTVVREREQRTLETLLCLPVEPVTILSAKWWAALHGYRLAFATLAGLFLMGCVLEWSRLPWMLGQAWQWVSWCILLNTLALWLSVRCRSSASAMIQLILWGLASLVVPPLLAPLFGEYAAIVNGMSFSAGWSAVFDVGNLPYNLAGAGIDSLLSLIAAGLLWRDACRRFETIV